MKIKKFFHTMKVNNEKAIEVNSDIKLNVRWATCWHKNLKEKCEIDYEDEVQEITVASTPMNKIWHCC